MSQRQTMNVLAEIQDERHAQDVKWGEQNWPSFSPERDVPYRERLLDTVRMMVDARLMDGTVTWDDILSEEIAEAGAETEPTKIRAELVQAAAVIVAWIESIDRNEQPTTRPPMSCSPDGHYHVSPHVGCILR